MEDLKIVHAQSPFPTKIVKTIFLAGPTDRGPRPTAWRLNAIQHLRDLGFDGHVFVPEAEDGSWNGNLDGQFKWEDEALCRADAIVFWMPRDLQKLPGFTTNIEWGLWADSGKVIWGAPEGAAKIDWAERYARKFGAPIVRDLRHALRLAVELIGEGAFREGTLALIPILDWRAALNAPPVYPQPNLTADNVVFCEKNVLLILRKDEPYAGQWAFPGGYVNKNEEPHEAAVRELNEEATLVSGPMQLVGIYGKEGRDPRGWVVSAAYTSEAISQEIKANDDAEDAGWFPIDEALLMPLAFDHSTILRDALRIRKTSED